MTDSNQFHSIARPLAGQSQPLKGLPAWRLWLPLAFQAALILVAPIQPVYTLITGKTVILETVPVDPYDFLRGYSQSLKYDVSSQDFLSHLPGWKELANPKVNQKSNNLSPAATKPLKYLPIGTSFYVILAAPKSAKSNPPQSWQPVRVSRDRPSFLPKNQIALKGKSIGYSVEYGLETYYMPEHRRNEINQDINQAQWGKKRHPIVAEVKVDSQGRAIPVSFWVSDRHYRF